MRNGCPIPLGNRHVYHRLQGFRIGFPLNRVLSSLRCPLVWMRCKLRQCPRYLRRKGQVSCGVLHLRYWGNSDPLANIYVRWHRAGKMRRDQGLAKTPCLEMRGCAEQLIFYLGFSPRQLIEGRLVCKRWAALLVDDRFWWRHLGALPARIEAPLRGSCCIYAWYVELAYAVRTYFEGPLGRQRDQQLWEALLLAGLGETDATLTPISNTCLTRIERGGGSCVVVALASRHFKSYELELRRATARKRRKRETLVLHLWYGDEAREVAMLPQVLCKRLLGLLLDGRSGGARVYKRSVI